MCQQLAFQAGYLLDNLRIAKIKSKLLYGILKKVVYTSAFRWELTVDEIIVRNVTTLSPDATST
jgi:hypothetical protein